MALLRSLPLQLLLMLMFLHPSLQEVDDELKLNPTDQAALLVIRNSLTDLPGTDFFSSWDFAAPDPCSSFAGVTCSLSPSLSPATASLRVTSLTLGTGLSNSRGLAGSLSQDLTNLSELTQLILNPGFVTGPIPPELGRLSNLQVLSLTNNRLTGSIPDTLSALWKLHTLDVSCNQLAGLIPPGITELTQLKVLVLASNRFSGALPNFPASRQLLHMDLKLNQLMGPLPSLPSTLRYLSLSGNAMWGPLNGLEALSDLVYLDLAKNHFGGAIPVSLLRPSLSSLFLQRNNFTGVIPAVPPRTDGGPTTPYGEGSVMDLSHNSLTGELPAVLSSVEMLFLNNNRLSGSVPEEYTRSVCRGRTKTLYLQHNFFSGFPLKAAAVLPDNVDVCLAYNCMVPPVGLASCPESAGSQLSRPAVQCSVFHNGGQFEG